MKINKIFTALIMLLLAITIVAQTPANQEQGSEKIGDTTVLQVKGDQSSMTQENDEYVQRFKGNVVAQLGNVTIHSEQLTVHLKSRKFIATGAVSVTMQGQTIKAAQLEWGYGPTPIKLALLF